MEYIFDYNKNIYTIEGLEDSDTDDDSSISSNTSSNSSNSSGFFSNDYYNSENLSKTEIIEKINNIKKMFNLPTGKNEKYCPHMENDFKIKCQKCEKIYSCTFCHDEDEDHKLIYKEAHIICCYCNIEQNFTDYCIGCEEKLKVKYVCKKCIIFDNSQKYKYHCNNCNKCHDIIKSKLNECIKCKICYTKKNKHICFNIEDDCPICLDKLKNNTIINLKCGHVIHDNCYNQLIKNSYKCPLCFKTILDMKEKFEKIDEEISNQTEENTIYFKKIYCNDCENKSESKYNYLGTKCNLCGSYNTRID